MKNTYMSAHTHKYLYLNISKGVAVYRLTNGLFMTVLRN